MEFIFVSVDNIMVHKKPSYPLVFAVFRSDRRSRLAGLEISGGNFWSLKTQKTRFRTAGAKMFGQNNLNVTDFWSARNHLIKPPPYVFAVFLIRGVMNHIH